VFQRSLLPPSLGNPDDGGSKDRPHLQKEDKTKDSELNGSIHSLKSVYFLFLQKCHFDLLQSFPKYLNSDAFLKDILAVFIL
jgi:hypothetical protein